MSFGLVVAITDDFGAKAAKRRYQYDGRVIKKYENVQWQLVIKKLVICKLAKHEPQKAKQAAADRLSKALRVNLHRRKAQARARKSTDTAADKAGQTNKDGR